MWWELSVDVSRKRLDRVSAWMFEQGAAGVQEEHRPGEAPPPRQPWDRGPEAPPTARLILKGWFEDPDREAVTARIAREAGLDAGPIRWSVVPEEDWERSWRAHFPVVEVSPRIVLAPPWDPRPGALILEPGQGFGTGQHPTTRAALRAIDDLARPGGTCLDVGCGSGVLAIAAARLGMAASGNDVEDSAVAEAAKNAERNGVVATFTTAPLASLPPADLVVANLHAELIVALAADLRRVTRSWLVLAGVLADREAQLDGCFPGWTVAHREVDGEWVSLRLRPPGIV